MFLDFKNWVKSIQTAGYNGARMVNEQEKKYLYKKYKSSEKSIKKIAILQLYVSIRSHLLVIRFDQTDQTPDETSKQGKNIFHYSKNFKLKSKNAKQCEKNP